MDETGIVLSIGPFGITRTVVTTWGILVGLWAICMLLAKRLRTEPGQLQTVVEGIVLAQENAISQVLPGEERRLLPFIGGLWVFIVVANLLGVVPGLSSYRRTGSAYAVKGCTATCSTICDQARSCCRFT